MRLFGWSITRLQWQYRRNHLRGRRAERANGQYAQVEYRHRRSRSDLLRRQQQSLCFCRAGRDPNAHSNRNGNAYANSDSYTYCDPYAYTHCHPDSNASIERINLQWGDAVC